MGQSTTGRKEGEHMHIYAFTTDLKEAVLK
jgi:hypothetical protein